MSNNKNNEKLTEELVKEEPVREESANLLSELDQLRHIVFGDAQQQLITQLTALRSDTEQMLNAQEQQFSTRLDKMQEDITEQLEALDSRLQFVDKVHGDNEANIEKEHASLVSEHEMLASATQQDFKDIEQLLNNESTSLLSTFNEQLEQLKNHLEDVSKELSSSKTDRKTLAKLLATMATNLADDQL